MKERDALKGRQVQGQRAPTLTPLVWEPVNGDRGLRVGIPWSWKNNKGGSKLRKKQLTSIDTQGNHGGRRRLRGGKRQTLAILTKVTMYRRR